MRIRVPFHNPKGGIHASYFLSTGLSGTHEAEIHHI